MLSRLVKIQLIVFSIASFIGLSAMAVQYLQVQSFVGIGRMSVTLQLPATGGLYRFSRVTYRGVDVGKVTNVDLIRTGTANTVRAKLSIDASTKIPADLQAHVRSVSAVGEQYVDLVPRADAAPYLHDGSVISADDATIPQPVGPMLDQVSLLLDSIPKDKLRQLLDESFKGVNGAAYDLQSLVDSTSKLAAAASEVSDQTPTLTQDTAPLLDSQAQAAESIQTWTRSLASVTGQLVTNDPQVRTLLQNGPGFADESARLLQQLKPTVPVLLANLSTLGQLAVTYNASLEQLLVLAPPLVSVVESAQPNRNASGLGLGSFRVSGISDPPPCTVGFLPPSSWRPAYDTTTIDTPDDIYCKLPQDSPVAVRGLRNFPCMTKPGKRAPTAEICNSDQDYEPLAQKQPVIGPYPRDPSLEAQGIPPDSRWFPDQGLYSVPGDGPTVPAGPLPAAPPTTLPVAPPAFNAGPRPPGIRPPDTAAPPPPPSDDIVPAAPSAARTDDAAPSVGFAQYNPRTGEYVGPDGRLYRQADLVPVAVDRTWKDLVLAST
jgi:phospholipid/cholesterol/gamma-HCH transport system substrate-binding protein